MSVPKPSISRKATLPAGAATARAAVRQNVKSEGIRPRLLTIPEAVAYCRRSRTGLYADLAEGKVKAVRMGRRTLIVADSLDAMIDAAPVVQFGHGRSAA